jgi:uncharacterized membrane protein
MMNDRRVILGSYPDYESAQQAVDVLADKKVPVANVAIVASDLRLVEQVTGRQTWVTAAVGGAGSGALTGALLGFLFGLFSIVDPLVSGLALAFYGMLLGAVSGLAIGIIAHAATGGRRDFRSFRTLDAARYDVVADAEIAGEALAVLEGQDLAGNR